MIISHLTIKNLKRFLQIGYADPESIIYEFKGISVYDELIGENVLPRETFEIIEVQLNYNGILYLTTEEFEDLGGEITLHEDEDDELDIELSCSGDVYFFMKEEDENVMSEYLAKSIDEINKIYLSVGLPLINDGKQM